MNRRFTFPIVDAKSNFVVIAHQTEWVGEDIHRIYYSYSTDNGSNWSDHCIGMYSTNRDHLPHVSIEPGSGNRYYLGFVNYETHNYHLAYSIIDTPLTWHLLPSPNDNSNVSSNDRVALVSTYLTADSLGVAAAWACSIGYHYDIRFDASWMPYDDVKEIDAEAEPPQGFELSQNYPNPFNPTTNIEFLLPRSGQVKIEIFNILGQKVRTLVDQHLKAGHKQVDWDGKDDSGKEVSSGIYFYKIKTPVYSEAKKMILMR